MKKILIVSHALELGGAERSLVGLLESLDPDRVDIDLFLLRHDGELLKDIPKYVHLLPEIPKYTVLARPMKDTLLEGHIVLTLARLYGKIKAERFKNKWGHTDSGTPLEYSHKYTKRFMPDIRPDIQYDLAISFLTPHYFVIDKVRATQKIAWIHTDYSSIQVDKESEYRMWNAYNYLVAVSEQVKKSFEKTFPSLRDKTICIENILSKQMIERKANENKPNIFDTSVTNIVSVGRFSYAKNFDNVPDICRKLLDKGRNIKWYLIGYGPDEELIKTKIRECDMEQNVIVLGKKENPYPFMNCCDIYIQPSRYEGKCVSVREAQLLGKPVVITNYATSASQVENGVDGLIVPLDNASCAEALNEIIKNKPLLNRLGNNCIKRDYTNKNEVEKIYGLLKI